VADATARQLAAVMNAAHARDALATARADHAARTEAHRIIGATARALQARVHGHIAAVVSRCLTTVFDDPYTFRIDFVETRGQTEARLVFVRDGQPVDPMTAAGGGVVDVAAFALRMAALMMSRPAARRVLVLDEPFKFVSAEYRDNVRAMLEGLSADLGVQVIMVTHIDALRCGDVVEVV
jgi:hypothetical protein